ncbi:MAG: sulfotransferase [Pseudomonadales bacterium]|nr:sulfotransferase [Pseudomonadales bacterium]
MSTIDFRTPNFIVIGAPKCASTSLYQYLIQHPDLYLPKKLPGFFSHDSKFRKVETMDEYLNLFNDCQPHQLPGEVSEVYYSSPGAAQRIRNSLPDVKIICCIRNPADRAYSGYLNNLRHGGTSLPIEKAFEGDYPWVRVGRYAEFLKPYFDCFPQEQIKIVLFEDLKTSPDNFLRDIFQFLGVNDEMVDIDTKVHNPALVPRFRRLNNILRAPEGWKIRRYVPRVFKKSLFVLQKLNSTVKPNFSQQARDELIDYYLPDIVKLEGMTGICLKRWKA